MAYDPTTDPDLDEMTREEILQIREMDPTGKTRTRGSTTLTGEDEGSSFRLTLRNLEGGFLKEWVALDAKQIQHYWMLYQITPNETLAERGDWDGIQMELYL